ncbi:MAG TPA: TadE/TadG family type IV pilus assembly protein, partial [Actinomycetota bacterium]|nr:TadE/TadG family type IV pilus assembly protein [Actinomycetota bacterium]
MSEERGTASLELALVVPTLMLLVLGALQFGLWYHAQGVVQSAALEGARVAAAEDGTGDAGRARAVELVGEGLGDALVQTGASASVDPEAATVRVTARLRMLLPFPGLNSFPLS